jgi:hypothetical protein
MAPRTQKKRFLALADQLKSGKELTPSQRDYLVSRFSAIGHGEDGNSVFGLSYTQGRSESDEKRRENLRLIFSWISAAIDQEFGHGWTLKKAIDEAAALSATIGSTFRAKTRDAIERAWYSKKYQYLKEPILRATDLDSPIGYQH